MLPGLIEYTAMTVTSAGAQANIGSDPDVVSIGLLHACDLRCRKTSIKMLIIFMRRHAEQQEFVNAAFKICLDLVQQAVRSFPVGTWKSGNILSIFNSLDNKQRLDKLFRAHADFARQLTDCCALTKTLQAHGRCIQASHCCQTFREGKTFRPWMPWPRSAAAVLPGPQACCALCGSHFAATRYCSGLLQ